MIEPSSIGDARFPCGSKWVGLGGHVLEFTHKGNLELRTRAGTLLWETQTNDKGGNEVVLKKNGNLVICEYRGYPIWSTQNLEHDSVWMVLQADGNLVIYSQDTPVWNTRTGGQ